MPVFLDLASRVTLQLDSGNNYDLEVRDIAEPNMASPISPSGQIPFYNYMDAASRLYGYNTQHKRAPASLGTSIGKIGFNEMVYTYSFVCAHYRRNGNLPSHIDITPISTPSTSTAASIPDELKPYLEETKNCQVSNTVIQNVAKKLASAQNVFNYVLGLTYDYYYNTKRGAVKTIQEEIGNCTDLTHALVALARAKGIPARYVHCTSVKFSKITTGHVWAELYINGSWVRADASNNSNTLGNYPKDSQLLGTVKRYAELPF